mmetsp:Transcript_558/g.2146  ORF Transcript_558/g.2146 Transcript_558/m.2146 type:complete len:312 (-) Transcript_558:107-1042(-)
MQRMDFMQFRRPHQPLLRVVNPASARLLGLNVHRRGHHRVDGTFALFEQPVRHVLQDAFETGKVVGLDFLVESRLGLKSVRRLGRLLGGLDGDHLRLVCGRVIDLLRLLLGGEQLGVCLGGLLCALVLCQLDVLVSLLLLGHRLAVLLWELNVGELQGDGSGVHTARAVAVGALELDSELRLHLVLDDAALILKVRDVVLRARVLHGGHPGGVDDAPPFAHVPVLDHHGLHPLHGKLVLEGDAELDPEAVPGHARGIVDVRADLGAGELDENEARGTQVKTARQGLVCKCLGVPVVCEAVLGRFKLFQRSS